MSTGVCLDCFGIFEPYSYAEISLMQGESGEKSVEKKRKTALKKFVLALCGLGYCDGVELKRAELKKAKGKIESVSYAYTPYFGGEAGEIIYIPESMNPFQIIRLAEFDATGIYAEQVSKIIRRMNGNYIKGKLYAIPADEMPRVKMHNSKPTLPFYMDFNIDK